MSTLRKATFDDLNILYEWANDPAVRKNSFHSEPIPYENHQKWFEQIMADESVLQFILMDEGMPVGQIRLSVDKDEAEIGYSIAQSCRGKGYGHEILRLIAEEIRVNYPYIKKLVAKVKPDNIASNKLFESEGYEMKYSCYTLEAIGGGITN